MNNNKKNAEIKFGILISLFLILILSGIVLNRGHITKEILEDLKDSKYMPLFFILFYVLTSFIPLPFTPHSFIGALLFRMDEAFLYTLLGSTIFSTIMFGIARYLGKEYIDFWLRRHKKLEKENIRFRNNAFKEIIFMRFFFIIPSEFINILCGLSKVKFKDYFLASLIGNAPVLFFSTLLVRAKITGNEKWFYISLISLTILLIVPLIVSNHIKKYTKNRIKNLLNIIKP